MIIFDNVHYLYDKTQCFEFSTSIKTNSFVIILGPSGSGKTTFLMLLAGLIKPNSGSIIIDNQRSENLSSSQRNLTMFFQTYNLFPHLTVLENLKLAAKSGQKLCSKELEEINSVLDLLNLNHMRHSKPGELSGGELQRAGIARCLVQDKSILLLDEPFSGLEPALRKDLIKYIYELHKNKNWTTLITTHHFYEYKSFYPSIIFVNDKKILFTGNFNDFFNSNITEIKHYISNI